MGYASLLPHWLEPICGKWGEGVHSFDRVDSCGADSLTLPLCLFPDFESLRRGVHQMRGPPVNDAEKGSAACTRCVQRVAARSTRAIVLLRRIEPTQAWSTQRRAARRAMHACRGRRGCLRLAHVITGLLPFTHTLSHVPALPPASSPPINSGHFNFLFF